MRHRRMRMQTEKSFVMVLAALITLMALVACGGGAGSSADESEEAAKAEEAAVAAGYVPAARMAEHIDQDVTVQGTVADYIRVTGSGSGKPTLLLFDLTAAMSMGSKVSDLKTPDTTAVLIWREDSKNFPSEFRTFYTGKTICVTGTVEMFQDNPVIIAKDQTQIEVDC